MKQTLGEEIANAITHGLGALFSIVALTIMVVFAALFGNVWQIVSVAIYGGTLVLLYTMSTLYHAFTNEKLKKLFKIFDHSAIYLLIAGTYTPFLLVVLKDNSSIGWIIFFAIWSIAIIGIILSIIFIGRFKILRTITFLLMGWISMFTIPDLIKAMQINNTIEGIYYLVAGGIAYTIGAVFYIFKVRYFHFIWHNFVLIGSILHFIAIMFYVL